MMRTAAEVLPGWRSAELRRVRRLRGLTQDDLAARLGVSRGLVAQWEQVHDARMPTPRLLPALAAGLRVNLRRLADITPLRAARLAAGLDIAELARRTHIAGSLIRTIDSGATIVDVVDQLGEPASGHHRTGDTPIASDAVSAGASPSQPTVGLPYGFGGTTGPDEATYRLLLKVIEAERARLALPRFFTSHGHDRTESDS